MELREGRNENHKDLKSSELKGQGIDDIGKGVVDTSKGSVSKRHVWDRDRVPLRG